MPTAESRGLALDTSLVVAALLSWHEQHREAARLLSQILDEGRVILPTRVLIESYSVLTRLPAPHRLAPHDAFSLLTENLRAEVELAELPVADRWQRLQALAEDDVVGGAVYDAEIVQAAIEVGAGGIATLNLSDFRRLSPADFAVVGP
jgi:predicted nucleic acid-binding protein